ncbi:chitin deacetylase [Gryganskiella cystojenkinii]|nr:chitin deacetylase [Gryganskiella cystojenkinii]
MVRIAAASLSVLVLTIAAVKAQIPIVPANYPTPNKVPPTNSPEVVQWLKDLGDLSAAPKVPLYPAIPDSPPACLQLPATYFPDECNRVCQQCTADDLTACAAPNTWGLTFDDGPSQFTPVLLDYLQAQKLSATFFLIGSNVIQYPQTALREVKEGHHIASHTWSHTALTTLTNDQIVAEMKWTEKAVLDATGYKLKYMRPPFGDINSRVRFVLKKMGYIPVDWTSQAYDTDDWMLPASTTEASVIANFTKTLDTYVAGPKTKGFYCLEHDHKAETVAVAQKLIPLGQAKKINFASVAGCENDAAPYQVGGTAPMPSVSGTNGVIKPTGTSSGNGTNPTGPAVIGHNAGSASATVSIGLVAVAAAVVGAFLA